MSALAGTIVAPFAGAGGGVDVGRWLRSALSLLIAIAVLAVALPVAFSSGASRAGADPVQVFSTGRLVSVEGNGSTHLSLAGMVPGNSRTATVRVANRGTDASTFSLAAQVADRIGAGGARLSEALALRVESAAGAVLYSGPIGDMPRLGLGDIPAGAGRSYRFSVALPADVGNRVEGAALSARFVWAAA